MASAAWFRMTKLPRLRGRTSERFLCLTVNVLLNFTVLRNSRPNDFSYKHDARHLTTFVIAQLCSDYVDDQFIRNIKMSIGETRAGESINANDDRSIHINFFLSMWKLASAHFERHVVVAS